VAKRQVLLDTIDVGWSKDRCLSQRTAAFGIFALKQMTFASAVEDNFAGGGYFEPLSY